LELTNPGKIGATVAGIILVLHGHREAPEEIYALREQLSLVKQPAARFTRSPAI
jgi:hypothetical protein